MLGVHDIGRQENKYTGLAELLGYGLGSAAGSLKNKYDQGQQSNQLMKLYGLDKEQATALAQQPPEVQQAYIKQLNDQKEQQFMMSLVGGGGGNLGQLLGGTEQQAQPGTAQQLSPEQKLAAGSGLSPKRFNVLSKIVGEEAAQKRHEEKQESRKQELSSKERERIHKFNKPYVDELYKDYKNAKHEGSVLDQMERLTENGNFSSPLKHNILKSFGIDWDSLLTNDDTTFKKLQNEFLPKMKSLFGGKVSNQEMEQFMKGIPALTQSPEGRKKLISMLKLMSEVPKIRYKKYKDIAKKYHDYDIREVVDDATEEKIDNVLDKLLGLQGIKRISDREALEHSERGQGANVSFNPSIFGGNNQQEQTPQKSIKAGDYINSNDNINLANNATAEDEDGNIWTFINGEWQPMMEK